MSLLIFSVKRFLSFPLDVFCLSLFFGEHELGIGAVPPLFSCRLVPITRTMELGTQAAVYFRVSWTPIETAI